MDKLRRRHQRTPFHQCTPFDHRTPYDIPLMANPLSYTRDRNWLLFIYFGLYYAILLGFFIDDRLLFQYRPIFFNYNRDLTELALSATGLPRWMIAHPGSFPIADLVAFLVPLPVIWQNLRTRSLAPTPSSASHRPLIPTPSSTSGRSLIPDPSSASGWPLTPWPGILFLVYLALYLLLADIFWQAHHELYILFFLLAFVWTTARSDRFYQVLTICRYYFLYLFVSAAIWKIARGAVFNSEEMSRILLLHHTDLLTGTCSTITCRMYNWLIAHPAPAQALYIGGVLLEASFALGFFTRRYDRLLIALAILFVVFDLLLMLIPYWTILLGVVPLWLGDPASSAMRGKATARRRGGMPRSPEQY